MNSLNSILIEGTLITPPALAYTPKGTAICSFTIESKRTTKLDGKIRHGRYYFLVTCYLALAETCNTQLRKGRGVRVVGRLEQNQESKLLYILAEHVELKPEWSGQRTS